ncbi:unknown [Salmonella phage FelixO1]|uniref:Uncharacterized protein n=1 Tax=Salmonella phage Felix O1 (isolate Felix O1-VT1) TaxID=1283336 RepID=Q6KGU8_BPFO1|nr:unknown [Salmonella phage FelixO1]
MVLMCGTLQVSIQLLLRCLQNPCTVLESIHRNQVLTHEAVSHKHGTILHQTFLIFSWFTLEMFVANSH